MSDKKNERANFFTTVYRDNLWQGRESKAGQGSDIASTQDLANALPIILRQLDIKSLLDLPCGDFHWMRAVDLGGAMYIGGDIVPELIQRNNELHCSPTRTFQVIDLVKDQLPKVDMVFVRDCLIHFTNELVTEALHNIVRSGSKYVCLTNDLNPNRFPNRENIELDRAVNGVNFEYRPNCFELPPFSFPAALVTMSDGSTWDAWNGIKAMCVWEVESVRLALTH